MTYSNQIELKIAVRFLIVVSMSLICSVQSKPTGEDENEVGRPEEEHHKRLRFFAVTDLDKKAAITGQNGRPIWEAFLIQGELLLEIDPNDSNKSTAKIVWDLKHNRTIKSYYSYGDRGMELSTLNVYNNELVSCDDKSGIIFKLPIIESSNIIRPIPWVILADGDGERDGSNGFKCEWGTIKNGNLWIGGHGLSKNDKYVKIISPNGAILEHKDWTYVYDKLSEALDISITGYITNEAVAWSDKLNSWIFMPRKISKLLPYSSEADETRASNTVLIADEDFNHIQVTNLGPFNSSHGVSEFKFIPGTNDFNFIALKEIELGDDFAQSFIYVGDMKNHTLLTETSFDDKKYEGLEFFKR